MAAQREADVSFIELLADSDSEDDIPLAELVPLGLARNQQHDNEQSLDDRPDEDAPQDPDVHHNNNSDLELDSDGEEGVGVNMPVNINLGTAMSHEWLGDFSHISGHKLGNAELNEIQVFQHIFTADVMELLVTETNRYAEQYFILHPKETLPPYSLARKWVAVDNSEMAAFVGILYFMGYIKLNSYLNYWNTEYLTEMRGFRSIMSRDRWHVIWQFFHLCNNDECLPRDNPNFDKLFKIRPLVEVLVNKWQAAYYPGQNLSVDESIVAFKGRASMVQYNPQKPHKWGIKAWVLSESKSGYMYNWELYRGGTRGTTEHGLSKNVVTSITRPVYGNKHHIYMDNFFSSPDLFATLAENKLGACGTLRANRVGVPAQIKNVQKTLKREDPPVFVRDGKFLFISWQDKKCVNVLTTLHNEETFPKTVRCRDAANNFKRNIIKPKAIELYNKNMGGVDLADQKLQVYLSVHRTLKWWKKIAIYLLEATFVNSSIIWKALNPANKVRIDKFRMTIITGLIATHHRHITPARNVDAPYRLVGRHFIGINSARTPKGAQVKPECEVCSNRAKENGRCQTIYICKTCGTPLHPYPCFERFHTLIAYKIDCYKGFHKA